MNYTGPLWADGAPIRYIVGEMMPQGKEKGSTVGPLPIHTPGCVCWASQQPPPPSNPTTIVLKVGTQKNKPGPSGKKTQRRANPPPPPPHALWVWP